MEYTTGLIQSESKIMMDEIRYCFNI